MEIFFLPEGQSNLTGERLRVYFFGLLLLRSSCKWWAVEKHMWEVATGNRDLMFGINDFDG